MKTRKKLLLIMFSFLLSSLFVACDQAEAPMENTETTEKEKLSVIIMLYVQKEDAANTSEEDAENPAAVFKYYGIAKGQEVPANLKTLENFLTRKLDASTEAFANKRGLE